jgi:multiple sugar transport system permease protein
MKAVESRQLFRPIPRLFTGIRAKERIFIVLVVGPAIIYYVTLRYWPVLQTMRLSLTDAQLISPNYQFVGLDNFRFLVENQVFRRALSNTAYYAFVTTIAGTALALILAVFLDPIPQGNAFLRLLFFLPQVTSAIAIATIWLWLFQARFGLFNHVLKYFGIGPIPWLIDPKYALNSLILMALWGGVGYSAILFVAGIRGIPKEYYEAAEIDGANQLQMSLRITLPLLSRVISFVLVTGVIGSFQVFAQVFLMTGGGPLDSTRTISLMIYQYAFNRLRIGQAAAMAVVLFMIVSALTLVQLRLQRSDWEL